MAVITDCTDPNQTLDTIPCLRCLSIHELWIVLTGLIANGNGRAADIDAVKEGGAKYPLLTEKNFLIGLITTLPDSFWDGIDADNVAQDFGCMKCWSESEVKAALLNQWCTFFQSYVPPN